MQWEQRTRLPDSPHACLARNTKVLGSDFFAGSVYWGTCVRFFLCRRSNQLYTESTASLQFFAHRHGII